MQGNAATLPVGAVLPVGAAFDTQAGLRRRAPKWLRKMALEWLFRLVLEPRRLWRRYLIGNAEFILLVLRQWGRKKAVEIKLRAHEIAATAKAISGDWD